MHFLFHDTAKLIKKDSFADFFTVLVAPERAQSKFYNWTMFTFLASKLYETLDTVILILNGKPTISLHVWHHATTYAAFYTGLYTGAAFWIGTLNSAIHVVMYLYYAKVSFIKPIAKYITYTQIFHLFGGAVLNIYTLSNAPKVPNVPIVPSVFTSKVDGVLAQTGLFSNFSVTKLYQQSVVAFVPESIGVDIYKYAVFNCFICLSYFCLFLAFFAKKYNKKPSGAKKTN